MNQIIEQVFSALKEDKEISAVDMIVNHFDNLFNAGKFIDAQNLLNQIYVLNLTPKILSSVLMITFHACANLDRKDFIDKSKSAFKTWGFSDESINKIIQRYTNES